MANENINGKRRLENNVVAKASWRKLAKYEMANQLISNRKLMIMAKMKRNGIWRRNGENEIVIVKSNVAKWQSMAARKAMAAANQKISIGVKWRNVSESA